MPDGDDDDDDDDVLRFVNRFVYACALCRELCNTQAHYSRTIRLSSFLSLSLSLSLSLESKANTKVVSKLSCERVFMEKRTDGFPQREREREFSHTNTCGKARPRATLLHARFCVRRKERLLRELDFCFRSQRRSSDVVILVSREGKECNHPIGNGTPPEWWFSISEWCASVPPRPRVPQRARLGNKTPVPFFET